MREVVIDGSAAGWRAAARALLADAVPPGRVAWRIAGDAQGALALAAPAPVAPVAPGPSTDVSTTSRVPRRFLALADRVACHRDATRWHRLYRVLWRLTHGEPHLLEVRTDPDVRPLAEMAKAIDREVHKLHAFVRFRVVEGTTGDASDASDAANAPTYVAWFEPAHDVLTLAAPLFVRRFASMRWAILTPTATAHWDGAQLTLGPGARRPDTDGDDAEALWRTYYAHIFNPARVKVAAMRAEMPLRYWRNLPEAALIPGLLREAPGRVREMIEKARDQRRAAELRSCGTAARDVPM
ncbi:MAG: TIGR03915 family putative DNA repair protein, partial [Gemmatirosa sp.]